MSSSSPGNPRSLKRLSQKRTVAPHRPILAAIPGALRPSAACWMICARRTSPAPSLCERVIRPSLCASSSLNARTRRVIATSPARTGAPSNAQDSEKSHPTCRMHHLDPDYWKSEYAAAWARLDLLGAIAQRNALESALQQLDGRGAAREHYVKLLQEFEALLEGPEEPCHQYLKAHPEIICPTHDAYWSKLAFGDHVSDFVFREPYNDYVLV